MIPGEYIFYFPSIILEVNLCSRKSYIHNIQQRFKQSALAFGLSRSRPSTSSSPSTGSITPTAACIRLRLPIITLTSGTRSKSFAGPIFSLGNAGSLRHTLSFISFILFRFSLFMCRALLIRLSHYCSSIDPIGCPNLLRRNDKAGN